MGSGTRHSSPSPAPSRDTLGFPTRINHLPGSPTPEPPTFDSQPKITNFFQSKPVNRAPATDDSITESESNPSQPTTPSNSHPKAVAINQPVEDDSVTESESNTPRPAIRPSKGKGVSITRPKITPVNLPTGDDSITGSSGGSPASANPQKAKRGRFPYV